ncbi:hypothetical protein K402DRAFT_410550 [Aulographum hederae CBS 113979]|uniref:ADF-H domain-containing protein n=1 Tax=Aulographum hederae CBS 113979 TaxID=1176131 RepID=A0A6G1HA69_9PEZI|nr:hypothetical protein K402DRAFT_410550 [Aulographum hederae CBS 113979]
MSLNGLDGPPVTEAYQAALAEAGGWLLLKYVSRDEVDILTKGHGGVVEARAGIVQYTETSPLYGFLLYRRRKVIIKYIPDGTSRLVQVRMTVHFQSVCERFPHDTTLSITTADELTDNALAAACSLHTAGESNRSSNNSNPRTKLDEITEDAEEGPGPETSHFSSMLTVPSPAGSKPEQKPSIPDVKPASKLADTLWTPPETPKASEQSTAESNPKPPDAIKLEPARSDYAPSIRSVHSRYEYSGDEPRPSTSTSTATARPSIDMYSSSLYSYKPKVKLGPRPSIDRNRPSPSDSFRPTASLPQGLKMASRSQNSSRPKSRDSHKAPSIHHPPPPPIPEIPQESTYVSRPTSSHSVRSLPASLARSNRMTPEKQRLMKAMELRKKQMGGKNEPKHERKSSIPELPPIPAISENTSPAKDSGAGSGLNTLPEHAKADSGVDLDISLQDVRKSEPEVHSQAQIPAAQTEVKPPPVAAENASRPSISNHARTISEDINNPVLDVAEFQHVVGVGNDGLDTIAETPRNAHEPQPAASQQAEAEISPSGKTDVPSEPEADLASSDEIGSGKEVPAATAQPIEASATKPDLAPSDTIESDEDAASSQSIETPAPVSDSAPSETSAQGEGSSIVENAALDVPSDSRSRTSWLIDEDENQDTDKDRTPVASVLVETPKEADDATPTEETGPTMESQLQDFPKTPEQAPGLHHKRRGLVQPLQVDMSAESSEVDYDTDDSFMEELKTAKVQEARPVAVSKSPMTASFFPRKSSYPSNIDSSPGPRPAPRSISSGHVDRLQGLARMTSQSSVHSRGRAASNSPSSVQDAMAVAKKINVSSGISQRIQALAQKSSSPNGSQLGTPESDASLLALRRNSSRTSPPSRRASLIKPINSSRSSVNLSNGPSESQLEPPFQANEPIKTVYNVHQKTGRPESVSVTARIVRDKRSENPDLSMPSDGAPLELHQSPLIIDHRKADSPVPSPKSHRKQASLTGSPISVEPSSPPSRESSNLPRSSSDTTWRSLGRRLSEATSPATLPKSPSNASNVSLATSDGGFSDRSSIKKGSKTSRLFKRMSNSFTHSSRKSIAQVISPTVQEEDNQDSQLPSPIVVGDLNVQLPDTLLWKRRWVEIDGQGYLVLTLSRSNNVSSATARFESELISWQHPKGVTKRYHLSEFKAPFLPDQDRQEMPNSVILDFVDGRTLQCACEDLVGRAQCLKILKEAHQAWKFYSPS